MIAVRGSFRFPVAALEDVRPLMAAVIAATLKEPGCLAYSYAEDVVEPGLIRVFELWSSNEALTDHFSTSHMRDWIEQRAPHGFSDRQIMMHEIGPGTSV